MYFPTPTQLRNSIMRPTIGYDYGCDCWDCTKPTRITKILNTIIRILFGG